MSTGTVANPEWLDSVGAEPVKGPTESERLWRGFMTARVTLGLVLVLLQGTLWALGQSPNRSLFFICSGYFAATLAMRVLAQPRRLGHRFDSQWAATLGIDLIAFAALQVMQGGNINYGPLLALPVLLAAVLGSLSLAMGTATTVSLLLITHSIWLTFNTPGEAATHLAQSALTGAGCFVIAFVSNQLSTRLAQEELRSRRSQLAVKVQRQVNELVIESLTDGILVVDAKGQVRAANPAAHDLLGAHQRPSDRPFDLRADEAWQGLAELAQNSFASPAAVHREVMIRHLGQGLRRLSVRTRLTTPQNPGEESLCVIFLQDLREMEARMRSDKLASMGRMSAAVAHEIRNPLAAIAQANALLDEDTTDPRHKQLTHMVAQNAIRLGKIVDEVLNISRVQTRGSSSDLHTLALSESVQRICRDWSTQGTGQPDVNADVLTPDLEVSFAPEHLRRVLINLLDNAHRYAGDPSQPIQIRLAQSPDGSGVLGVWSNGPPLEQSVERHLFEPFFSSSSRSSGLGMYICRELCEGHGATIDYQRATHLVHDQEVAGNEFFIGLRASPLKQPATPNDPPNDGVEFRQRLLTKSFTDHGQQLRTQ